MTNTTVTGISVGSAYAKDKDLGIKVTKTFFVPMEHIFIEEGFNVRDIDQDHVDQLAKAYAAGAQLPNIMIKTTPDGFKIIDGHHRYLAAMQAECTRLEVKEFTGSKLEELSFMITSSQGRQLEPVERAQAYQRMINQGMTKGEVAEAVHRSRKDVDNHLILLSAGDEVIAEVKAGTVSSSEVIKAVRKGGNAAPAKIIKKVKAAKEVAKDAPKGKGKKSTKVVLKTFKPSHGRQAMELIAAMDRALLSDALLELLDLYLDD
ncbi:MAG: ParB N-terminal domain-containing protein [Alteromonadaceae bacterium]|nr:ParB N-terminal domain-containing protein [Alteromonadaceae bacterium]